MAKKKMVVKKGSLTKLKKEAIKKPNKKTEDKNLKHPIGVIADKGELSLFFKSSALDKAGLYPVSYTHLTLPTNREV